MINLLGKTTTNYGMKMLMDDGWEYTWEAGHQLSAMGHFGLVKSLGFKYNDQP